MNQNGAKKIHEATMRAVAVGGPPVVMEYCDSHAGPALSIELDPVLLEGLAEQLNGMNRARQWIQARIREVVDLSPETIAHYLNFVLRQQLETFPEPMLEVKPVQVLPWCALANDAARPQLCATCALSNKYHCTEMVCELPRAS